MSKDDADNLKAQVDAMSDDQLYLLFRWLWLEWMNRKHRLYNMGKGKQ